MTTTYHISTSCNPYNARTHYHGERVIKGDNGTPVMWLRTEQAYQSLEDALKALYNFAVEDLCINGDYVTYNDGDIDEIKSELIADGESLSSAEEQVAWYQGEGIYDNHRLIVEKGERCYEDDTLSFSIHTAGELDYNYDFKA